MSCVLHFPKHFLLCPLPLFSNICRASVQLILHQQHRCLRFLITTNHNIYLTVLLSLKFTFTQWGTFLTLATMYLLISLSSHFTITVIFLLSPSQIFYLYIYLDLSQSNRKDLLQLQLKKLIAHSLTSPPPKKKKKKKKKNRVIFVIRY